LGPAARKDLSLQVLGRTDSVNHLAQSHGVSRKFLYQQAAKASEALDEVFAPAASDDQILFELPVTKHWLRQFVLAQVLIGHSSFRAVIEILDALFDYHHLALGSIHNIVREAVEKARQINQAQELCQIQVGAHDEIFQASKPVLVGMDVKSTYCYLLACADQRDETTWGVHLLDLAEQGLRPDYTIADGGFSLRAGQATAWDDIPCHGDVFHAERDLGKLAYFLENRAATCSTMRAKLEHKMQKAKSEGKGQSFSKKLAVAHQAENLAVRLAQDVRILTDWMQKDILAAAGPDLRTRQELYDFVIEQLQALEPFCPHRIRPLRCRLGKHRDDLLAFAAVLDQRFADLAARFQVPVFLVHGVCELQNLDKSLPRYWQRRAQLQKTLLGKFHALETAVQEVIEDTPRASSIVENLNSRLRNYFFLRRHIGNDYLHLLRFFLNHRRFQRSDRPERIGKSPAELLNGKAHSHWLELLGFERFQHS
jgi:hypothetical protein